MGKRLIRIFRKELKAKAASLAGRKINLVLQNQSTFYGVLLKVDQEGLELKDLLNKKHYFKFSGIEEIVYDQVAAY
ncbi:MAG: hypothetical protein ACJ75J_01060 [Cytophagaceae bacterium]